MPSWRKVITSGSDASLNSLYVTNGITGSLLGTASYAITSSYGLNPTISGSINNVNYIDFNTSASIPPYQNGRIFWDNTEGALSVYNSEADITLQVGQENWTRVFNDTGAPIINGAPVRIIGTHGDHPEVVLAASIQVSGSSNLVNQILGLATHTIEDGTFGYVTTQGLVRGLNTSAYNDGDTLYLSSSAGQLTATVPTAPYEIIPVGQVVKASPGGSGIIYVAVQQPLDFTDLSSVALGLGTYQDGDIWTYYGPTKQWRHQKFLTGSYVITGSLTISGSSTFTNVGRAIFSGSVISTGGFTGSLSGTAATASYVVTAQTASYVNTLNQNVLVNGTISGSTVYSSQHVEAAENLKSLFSSGDEGGEIFLNKPATNTTLNTGVTIDVNGNRLRFFENGGTNRGYYLDIASGGTSVGTNLAAGGGTVTSVSASGTVSGITLGGGPITGAGTLTLTGTISGLTNSNLSGTAGITNANLANSSITIGSTNIDLGDTTTILTGLTSLNSTSITGSLAGTASYATQALSASWAPAGNPFPYTGSAEITGSLGVTGSFNLQTYNGITNVTALDFGGVTRVVNDVMGSTSINADDRELYDSSTVLSVAWDGRRLVDTVSSQSVNWNDRMLKIDNGPGAFTVNWGGGLLRDTGSNNSVDWQNRIAIDTGTKTSIDWQNRTTIDTGTKTSIDWQNRQLKDSSGNGNLNWSSGISITGSATVSGSLTVTGSLLITGSSTLINQGPTILSGSFKVQGTGTGFAGPFPAIEVDDANFSRKLYDFNAGSASIDFGSRTLFTANNAPAISWDGSSGVYNTNLYNSQTIDSATRGNLYGFNVQGGQTLAESYFDTAVMDNDLVYLNPDGQWYQVDQTTNSSTKMLGIAKNVFSQTGSVFIEGDIVVSTGPGYPSVGNANYGLPVYIKQGAGIAMDTTIPVSGYVRILGHCYWSPGPGISEWIMKFRPSNEWIQL